MINSAFDKLAEERPTPRDMPYSAPDMFPGVVGLKHEALREAVEQGLVDHARAGTLNVTDLMNQSVYIKIMAGDIIMGQAIDYTEQDRPHIHREPPEELMTYPIRVRLLPCPEGMGGRWPKTILWKKGLLPRRMSVSRSRTMETMTTKLTVGGAAPASGTERVPLLEEVQFNTGKTEATMRIDHAWNCLRMHGKFCRREIKAKTQLANWWYVEVRTCPMCGGEYEAGSDHSCVPKKAKKD